MILEICSVFLLYKVFIKGLLKHFLSNYAVVIAG